MSQTIATLALGIAVLIHRWDWKNMEHKPPLIVLYTLFFLTSIGACLSDITTQASLVVAQMYTLTLIMFAFTMGGLWLLWTMYQALQKTIYANA